MKLLMILLGASLAGQPHDVITTPITRSREIARIVLITYADIRPCAEAVNEGALARRMPPWGVVKGFGDFRNDRALTAEQLELIGSWANGGVPEGDTKDLPVPPSSENIYQIDGPAGGIAVWLSDFQNRFKHSFLLRAPLELPAGAIIRGVPSDATVLLLPATTEMVTKDGGE
jgi:hypothetical protein